MMKIVLMANQREISGPQVALLNNVAEVKYIENEKVVLDEIPELFNFEEVIFCPFPEQIDWSIPNSTIERFNNVKAICLPTTSFHWLDTSYCRKFNIDVTHTPIKDPTSIVEGIIFMFLSLARRYPETMKLISNGREFSYIPNNHLQQLSGRTLGVIGLGNIGKTTALLGKRLGMNVLYWSRKSRDKRYKYVELNKLLKTSDFISSSIAINNSTKNMIERSLIDLIPSSTSVVSIKGTEIFDWEYLHSKVENNEIYGLGFESEKETILDFKGNVFVTPHNNWFTKELIENKVETWVETIVSNVMGNPVNVVN